MDPAEITLFLSETLAGRYRPTTFRAAGGFAGIFEAVDAHTNADVAAKILQLKHCSVADSVREFKDEAALLMRLRGCDRVVQLLDSGTHTVHLRHAASGGRIPVDTQFAVLELAVGSLADLLLSGSAFAWPDRLRLFRDVVKGVHQMHLNGIVHRDVKSENALLMEHPPIAKIADLGRARDTAEAPRFLADQYFHGRGDVRFAPLEFLWLQGSEDPDEQAYADLYLIGSLLFEIAANVGLTSLVAANPIGVMSANAALPAPDRARNWEANVPLLRDALRPAYETFSGVLPAAIRPQATDLIRLLTDPEPKLRVAGKRGGSRISPTPWDLQWLLDRIDGLRRAIDPALRKSYLAARPKPVPHGRPPARR